MATVKVRVLRDFYDLVRHKDRRKGEVFEATEERAAYIDDRLPGFVAIETADGKDAPKNDDAIGVADLKKMTMTQLAELAKQRGIELKGRPKKAELIELLTKE